MFHVLLGLPVLAAFGADPPVVLFLMGLILAFAFFGQLLLGLFCRTIRWLLYIPVILGAAGLVLCLVAGLPLSLTVILLFWAVYGVLALCGWGISRLLLGLWHLIMGK